MIVQMGTCVPTTLMQCLLLEHPSLLLTWMTRSKSSAAVVVGLGRDCRCKVACLLFIVSYASLSKIQQEFICKPHAVLGQGVLIFQTTASNYMNEDIDHSFLVPSACIRSHSCFSSEFSFELPLGNIRTFFKCHLFWSQGVSQLQGDGVMDA